MQIPKIPKKPVPKEKKCQYEGCSKMFMGIHANKYCDEHKDPNNRAKKKEVEVQSSTNQIIQHQYTDVKTMMLDCALEGCDKQFELKIYPRQFVYPKYCSDHRSEHKRKSKNDKKNYAAKLL
jgi:hypothetical protein